MNDNLAKYFDEVIKNNDDDAFEAFTMYIETKAKEVLKGINEAEKPIRLDGNDVLVNGKKVGTINHNADKEDGIEYTSEDGKKSKHETLPKLFDHLTKENKLEEAGAMHVLQTKKKGTDKWGTQFSGSKAECHQEWKDTKHDWEGHDHQVVPHKEDVSESASFNSLVGSLAKANEHKKKASEATDEASKKHHMGKYHESMAHYHSHEAGVANEKGDTVLRRKHEGEIGKHYDKAKEYNPKLAESLADAGNKELANKSEKAFKSFKNDDDLKLTKQAAHKDNADHSDAEKEKAAAAKAKAKARATVDAAAIRKVDWKL